MQLSLTDLVDIVSASGTPKFTKVKTVKNRPPYSPAFDFYRPFREHLAAVHAAGGPPADLDKLLPSLTDPKKVSSYPAVVQGYKKWWAGRAFAVTKPPMLQYTSSGVTVNVNPELLVNVGGSDFLVKLYFKGAKLTKNRIDIITHLMATTHGIPSPGATMGVLDVRRAKLHTPTVPIAGLSAMLSGELAYVAAVWPCA